jgi:hypothetical protein
LQAQGSKGHPSIHQGEGFVADMHENMCRRDMCADNPDQKGSKDRQPTLARHQHEHPQKANCSALHSAIRAGLHNRQKIHRPGCRRNENRNDSQVKYVILSEGEKTVPHGCEYGVGVSEKLIAESEAYSVCGAKSKLLIVA